MPNEGTGRENDKRIREIRFSFVTTCTDSVWEFTSNRLDQGFVQNEALQSFKKGTAYSTWGDYILLLQNGKETKYLRTPSQWITSDKKTEMGKVIQRLHEMQEKQIMETQRTQ